MTPCILSSFTPKQNIFWNTSKKLYFEQINYELYELEFK